MIRIPIWLISVLISSGGVYGAVATNKDNIIFMLIFSLMTVLGGVASIGLMVNGSAITIHLYSHRIQKYCLKESKGRIGHYYLEKRLGVHFLVSNTFYPVGVLHDIFRIHPNYTLFAVEEHPTFNMVKVIALHHTDSREDAVFLIGTDKYTNQPFVLRCPPQYYNKPIQECLNWCLNIGKGQELIEV